MDARQIAFRQIHLDFHTAPQTPDVGADFDPREFVETLKEARVDSITCFSRCHHGMIYHDTQFSARHPNLRCNLLAEQIEACHSAGIRVPIYITVGLDMYAFANDPGLVQIAGDGVTLRGTGTLQPGWVCLCFNSRYIDYVVEQTLEVLDIFPTDGLFFDIVVHDCCCQRCVDLMLKGGYDPYNESDRYRFNQLTLQRFRERMTRTIRSKNADCTIFYNSGHVDYQIRPHLDAYSHFELESLPSGGWGYDHFPITGRYVRRLNKPWLMMTGRFHTSWGDFGSYKHPAALEYECLRSVAMGGACSVGDQLHPNGKLEPATYRLIGQSYEQVEKVEDAIRGTEPAAEVGIFWSECTLPKQTDSGCGLSPSDRGAYRMCLEEHLFFDFIDMDSDLEKYRLLILPDKVRLDKKQADRMNAYLDGGGAIVCSGESGLSREKDEFVLPVPLKIKGPAEFCPEYILAKENFDQNLPEAPIVMYLRGLDVQPTEVVEELADVIRPYFNRLVGQFCGHRHWPAQGPAGRPAIVRAGRIVYFAHPIFEVYGQYASRHYKQLVANAIDLLVPDRILRTNLPSTAQVELSQGPDRSILTVLHYVPENRNSQIATIEEALPLVDVEMELKTSGKVREVKALLGETENFIWSASENKIRIKAGKIYGKLVLSITN